VTFDALEAADATESAPPTPAAETTTDQNLDAGTTTESSAAGATSEPQPAPATEASAAALPTGAPVGPAGLEVQGYTLRFSGDFFSVADLLASIDSQIRAGNRPVVVQGRLMTIDGFSMEVGEAGGGLSVELNASSYLLPASQGLTAGATPALPPESVPAPASPTTTTSTTTP
jgi:hypothetical protein